MKPEDFKNILGTIEEGDIAEGYYLFGEESYLKQAFIVVIKRSVVSPDFAEFNFDEFWGKDIGDGKELFDAILALPMMADKRLVILREAERCRKSVHDGFKDFQIPNECILIIEATPSRKTTSYHKLFSKILEPVSCEIANDREMISWVLQLALDKGIDMDRTVASHLVQRVGVNLQTLDSELDKFALLVQDEPLSVEIIDKMTAHSRSANIFTLSDSFASKDFAQSLEAAERLFEFGESGTMMIAFLKNELMTLLRLKSDPDGMKKVRIPGWKRKNYVNWVRKWRKTELHEIIKGAADADIAIKTGKVTERQAVTEIIALAETLKYGE